MAKVEIEIGANPKPFESALDSMRSKAQHFGNELGGMATKMAAGFGAERIIENVVEQIGEAIAGYKEFAQEVKRTGVLLGENADEVQRVAFAAKQANVDFNELQKGVLKLRSDAANAAKGDPDAKEAFANIGIDPEAFGAAKLSEQVLMLADSFEKLSQKGFSLQPMLDALGTKNRGLMQVFAEGRHQLEETFAETPLVSGGDLSAEDAARKRRAHHEAELRAKIGGTGIIEAEDQMHEVGSGIGGWLLGVGGGLYDAAIKTSNFLGTNDEHTETRAERMLHTKSSAADSAAFIERYTASHGGAPGKPAQPSEAPAGPAATPVMYANPSKREAMAESQREMDVRNAMLLEDDLGARAKSLKGEQRRIFAQAMKATGENDPMKAAGLILKGKGMESEIVAAMRQLNAPDLMQVKSGRGREMGLGGPMAAFGGVEVAVRESRDFLREIRDRLAGAGGGYGFNKETGQVALPTDAAGFGIGGLTRILTNVPNFSKDR